MGKLNRNNSLDGLASTLANMFGHAKNIKAR